MLKANLLFCLGVALLGTACNHENDRTMTPANGSTTADPPQGGPDPGITPTGEPVGPNHLGPDGSGTPGSSSGSGSPGSGSGTPGSGSGPGSNEGTSH